MKKISLVFVVLLISVFPVLCQKNETELKTVKLFSVFNFDNSFNDAFVNKGCFSFVSETVNCKTHDLIFGNRRSGNDWDWFEASGSGSRNKIVNLGKLDWADNFLIPVVEPYPKLKKNENRSVTIDTSGAKGKDGLPGRNCRNADGTITESRTNITAQTSESEVSDKKSDYQPFVKAIPGNMYLLRIKDDNNDFYVLFRVDELERGHQCTISWKRIDAPKEI